MRDNMLRDSIEQRSRDRQNLKEQETQEVKTVLNLIESENAAKKQKKDRQREAQQLLIQENVK